MKKEKRQSRYIKTEPNTQQPQLNPLVILDTAPPHIGALHTSHGGFMPTPTMNNQSTLVPRFIPNSRSASAPVPQQNLNLLRQMGVCFANTANK
jgi:hypothetical protein